MRRSLSPELAGNLGSLDPAAITEVAEESWPVVRDPDELHDALLTLVWVPHTFVKTWDTFLPSLIETGRATIVVEGGSAQSCAPLTPTLSTPVTGWVATERAALVQAIFPHATFTPEITSQTSEVNPSREDALRMIVQGWMESTGPTTVEELAAKLQLPTQDVSAALLQMEADGQVLRGRFRPSTDGTLSEQDGGFGKGDPGTRCSTDATGERALSQIEWCHRRLLARIYRLTIGKLRREIEPVTASDFMRFLFQWQHLAPGSRLHGEAGLLEIIHQLSGFEAAASAWERHLLPLRIAKYTPDLLDRLCRGGAVAWGRLSPHPRLAPSTMMESPDPARLRRIVPTSVAPISLFSREDLPWLLGTFEQQDVALGSIAQDILRFLSERGASFFADMVKGTRHLPAEVEEGLWELAAGGIVTADGFDNLRALLDPRRRAGQGRERERRPRNTVGRWSRLRGGSHETASGEAPAPPIAESAARQLLHRYGVVFRDLLGRESLSPPWRDLLVQYRRMELRGEIRGGRFVSGFTGEQFALPEAVETLRAMRRMSEAKDPTAHTIKISAADPLNLVGVILPGPRLAAVPTNYVVFQDSIPVRSGSTRETSTDGILPIASALKA